MTKGKGKRIASRIGLIGFCTLVILLLLVGSYIGSHAKEWWGSGAMYRDGQIGDYFNGMLGPFIALAGVITTFAAFYIQYRANEDQKRALRKQGKEIRDQKRQTKIDRFEQRFFEMLKIHRENAENFYVKTVMNEGIVEGRNAFDIVNSEICFLYEALQDIEIQFVLTDIPEKYQRFCVALKLVYWGLPIGNQYSQISVENSRKYGVGNLSSILNSLFENWDSSLPHSNNGWRDKSLETFYKYSMPREYSPLMGHYTYLSIYLRHLGRAIEMLDPIDEKLIPLKEKLAYASILRSQMSNDEQKLLYFYSLAEHDGKLWGKGWIPKYELIRDIVVGGIPAEIAPGVRMREYLMANGLPADDAAVQARFDDLVV